MLTANVLLRLKSGCSASALDGPLAEEAQKIGAALEGSQVRVASSLIHHRQDAERARVGLGGFDELLKAGGLPPAWDRVPLDSYDAVIELRMPDGTDPDDVIGALAGLVGRLVAVVDSARSCVVMGFEYTVIVGEGPVQLFYCLRRIPSITHEQFSDYWRNTLVEETTKTPTKTGYRQLHADLELSSRAASAMDLGIDDYDGVALEWYPTVDGFLEAVSWASDPDAAIIASESNINDFGAATAMLAYCGVRES
jgi:hypothetical protein